MFGEEETLLYEPKSFITPYANVNPDSPRHFLSRRRQNNSHQKLKRRPQTINDFRRFTFKKEPSTDLFMSKRSKTFIERCENVGLRLKGALHRTKSMDGLLNTSSDENNETGGSDKSVLNYSKPITSRLKVREKRNTNSLRQCSKPMLVRSKSDGGFSCPQTEFASYYDPPHHNYVIKTRSCDYGKVNDFSNRILFDDQYIYIGGKSDNSLDSFKSKSDSSANLSQQNSSGFSDFNGTESENDTLSSDCSSVFTSDSSFPGKSDTHMNMNFDQDKNAEEKVYSRSAKKNRRPLSVRRSRDSSDDGIFPSSPTISIGKNDDVFMIDVTDDANYANNKYILDCIAKKSLPKESKTFTDIIGERKNKNAEIYEIDYLRAGDADKGCEIKQKKMIIIKNEDDASEKKTKQMGKTTLETAVEKLSISTKSSDRKKTRRTTIALPISNDRKNSTFPRRIRIESVV